MLDDVDVDAVDRLDDLRGHHLQAAVGVHLRVLEEEELVTVADGQVQIVEHRHHGETLLPGHVADGLEDMVLTAQVQAAGGLVQEQQPGLLGQGPGQQDLLGL